MELRWRSSGSAKCERFPGIAAFLVCRSDRAGIGGRAVNNRRYQLRLSGLSENRGHIKAKCLGRVVDGILTTAERVTFLLATGHGSRKGSRPGWLDDTVDFTITGIRPGSTIFDIEAPQIGETAGARLTQQDLWHIRPNVASTNTALDLVAMAVEEALSNDPVGDYFDSSVLEAILRFAKAAGPYGGAVYELLSEGSAHPRFAIDDEACTCIERKLRSIPGPKNSVVSGRLEEIRHSSGRFVIRISPGVQISGEIDTSALSVEALRSLWGRQTTVQGLVHFKANGYPRLIEAYKISGFMEGDKIFEGLPSASTSSQRSLSTSQQRHDRPAKPMDFSDSWPGDEPIEELMAQLD